MALSFMLSEVPELANIVVSGSAKTGHNYIFEFLFIKYL